LELRNRLGATFGITVPAALVWTYPTLLAITSWLLDTVSTTHQVLAHKPTVGTKTTAVEPIARGIRFRPVAAPRARIFCFHGGGGSPEIFANWADLVPKDVEVVGMWHTRQHAGEAAPWRTYLEDAVSLMKQYADAPFAFVGFSLG